MRCYFEKADFKNVSEVIGTPKNPLGIKNRFACINDLEVTVRQKKGGYTEEECCQWLNVLYSCLKAPNCYFEDSAAKTDKNSTGQMNKKRRKTLFRYSSKLRRFQRAVKQEREQYRSIYTYLVCIRDLLNKIGSYKKVTHNPFAQNLQCAVWKALDDRISDNPKLECVRDKYQNVLQKTFQTELDRLNHPTFFLFLPYYLFFELGKCEGLISETEAFSVPQLDKNAFNWWIRSSPIKAKDEEDYEQLSDLYSLIEYTLCTALHNCGYHSIGQAFLTSVYQHRDYYNDPMPPEDQTVKLKDAEFDYAVNFSVPIWNYNIWAKLLCGQFETDMIALLSDMHQLFNLSFRSSTTQAQHAVKNILQGYVDCSIKLRGRLFYLSQLLEDICTIYNLQRFSADDPFISDSMQKAVDNLLDFLIETGNCPVAAFGNSTDEKWLFLIKYGYSDTTASSKSWYDDISCYLISPSRVLYQALLMKSLIASVDIPMQYGIFEFLPYSVPLKRISKGMFHALCSQKAIAQDMLYWGGIKVEFDKKYTRTLKDSFHVWSVWHVDTAEADQIEAYFKYLGKHSNCLSAALSNLHPYIGKPVEVDLSTLNFDTGKNDALANQKQQLFASIPELKTIFGRPQNLDDFRYACILYFLFQTLRDQMCRQAFILCKKILRLS